MKKVLYYAVIVISSIVFCFLIGCALALIFNPSPNFGYAVGRWCGRLYVILLSVSFVLLLRRYFYKIIFKTQKEINSKVALWLMGVSIAWGTWSTYVSYRSTKVSEQILEAYADSFEDRIMPVESLVFVTMDDNGVSTFHADSCCYAIGKNAIYQTTNREIALECGYNECLKCIKDSSSNSNE